jgi:hypothetical protein
MSLSDLASLGSFVSGAAVLASLVFLFFQMRQMTEQVRQTEKNQRALIAHGRVNRASDINMRLTDPALAEAVWKANTGADDLSLTQLWQLLYYAGAVFAGWSDSFYQFKSGLMNAEDFASEINAIKFIMARPGIRAAWKMSHGMYRKDFVEFMNGLIAETPVRTQHADLLGRWTTTFLGEARVTQR